MSLDKTIKNSLEELGDNIARSIDERNLSDTGESKQFEINVSGNKYQLLGVPYLEVLDKGRGPGKFPPVDVILDYVNRNNISINYNRKDLNANQTAYLIGKGIAEKGTRIYRGEVEGINLDAIIADWEKKLYEDIENEAVIQVKKLLDI